MARYDGNPRIGLPLYLAIAVSRHSVSFGRARCQPRQADAEVPELGSALRAARRFFAASRAPITIMKAA